MRRSCGDCTLCCKLLPMQAAAYSAETGAAMVAAGLAHASEFRNMTSEFDKPAGAPCPHQSHHKGCKIYARRPFSCRLWNCRWLTNDDTGELRRPDRARYVIDIMPDFITLADNNTGARTKIEVVQVWVDPKHRDAWREPAMLAYLERRGAEGNAAMIRWGSGDDAVIAFPPTMSADRQWHIRAGTMEPPHRGRALVDGLAAAAKVTVVPP